uniref:Uncharacterized protein n=1 Tax=Arundo donax TaxID=35708 RepID=A0A0A9BCV3_ARUDO
MAKLQPPAATCTPRRFDVRSTSDSRSKITLPPPSPVRACRPLCFFGRRDPRARNSIEEAHHHGVTPLRDAGEEAQTLLT